MYSEVREIAELLLYCGPNLNDMISNAIKQDKPYKLYSYRNLTVLSVTSLLPYELTVIDKYFYNDEKQLIKHILLMGEKEEVVFDKFSEAKNKVVKLSDSVEVVA